MHYSVKTQATGNRRKRNGKRFWNCLSPLCGAQQVDIDRSNLLARNSIFRRSRSIRSRYKGERKTASSQDSFLTILFRKLTEKFKRKSQLIQKSKKAQEIYNKLSKCQNQIITHTPGIEHGPQESTQLSPTRVAWCSRNACTRPGSHQKGNRSGFSDLVQGGQIQWRRSILIIVSMVVVLMVYGGANALHYSFLCTSVLLRRPGVYRFTD